MRSALLLLLPLLPSVASADLKTAAGSIPPNSEVTFFINLKGFENPQSLLSQLGRAQLQQFLRDEFYVTGQQADAPADTAMEAALRVALMSPIAAGTSTVGAGLVGYDLPQPREYAVVTGGFAGKDLGRQLGEFRLTASEHTGAFLFPAKPNRPFYLRGRDGLITVSTETIPAPPNSGFIFMNRILAAAGTEPDVIVYTSGSLIRNATKDDPMATTFVAPLLKADGFALVLLPGSKPSAELLGFFPDSASTVVAMQYTRTALELARLQISRAGENAAGMTTSDFEKVMEIWNNLEVSHSGTTTRVRYEIPPITDGETFRETAFSILRDAMTGDLPTSLPSF